MEVLVTTSRRPSRRTRTFCKDLSHVFPNVIQTNRGKLSLGGVAEKALTFDATKVILVNRWEGGTGKLQFFKIDKEGLNLTPPLIYVNSVKLHRDFNENRSRKRRINSIGVTTPQRDSPEAKRFAESLSNFFNIPILTLKEIYKSKLDAAVHLSSDTSIPIVVSFKLIPELVEIGPQIRISHLVWALN